MEQEITALIAAAVPRHYWSRAPQEPAPLRPYVRLARVSGSRNYHMRGPSGYVVSRVQIDAFADTYQSMRTTARAVISALSGYRGGTIQAVFVDGERNLTGLDGIGSQTDPNELFRTSIDVIVHHSE